MRIRCLSGEFGRFLERGAGKLPVRLPRVVEGAVIGARKLVGIVCRTRRGIEAALSDREVTPEGADARCNRDPPFRRRTRGHEMDLFVLTLEQSDELSLPAGPRREHVADTYSLQGCSIARAPGVALSAPVGVRAASGRGAKGAFRRLVESSAMVRSFAGERAPLFEMRRSRPRRRFAERAVRLPASDR